MEDTQSSIPRWAWYAGGAVIAIGLLVVLRRGSSAPSGTLAASPDFGGSQGQLDNLTAAVASLAGQIGGGSPTASAPSTLSNPLLDQFFTVRGTDNHAWVKVGMNGTWMDAGGAFLDNSFNLTSDNANTVTITGVGLDNGLWSRTYNTLTGQWLTSAWVPTGGYANP